MSTPLNEENLKQAFYKVLQCTGIGGADAQMLSKRVWVVVPEDMHDDYPARLLGCANHVCATDPYDWTVENTEPEIGEETTFQSLYDDWLSEIVYD